METLFASKCGGGNGVDDGSTPRGSIAETGRPVRSASGAEALDACGCIFFISIYRADGSQTRVVLSLVAVDQLTGNCQFWALEHPSPELNRAIAVEK